MWLSKPMPDAERRGRSSRPDVGSRCEACSVDSYGISHPVALVGGKVAWAEQLAAAGERPSDAVCAGCGERVVLRAGKTNRPHFAHKSGVGCTAVETALHAVTIQILRERIEEGMSGGRPFPLGVRCDDRAAHRIGNLARHAGGSVHVDRVLDEGIRPDLVIRSASGKPVFVVEVIVTHAPEEPASALYRRLGLPAVLIWPTWEFVAELRDGLPVRFNRRSGTGRYELVGLTCSFPRHPADLGKCGDCGACQ